MPAELPEKNKIRSQGGIASSRFFVTIVAMVIGSAMGIALGIALGIAMGSKLSAGLAICSGQCGQRVRVPHRQAAAHMKAR